jgi:hypothetical protein
MWFRVIDPYHSLWDIILTGRITITSLPDSKLSHDTRAGTHFFLPLSHRLTLLRVSQQEKLRTTPLSHMYIQWPIDEKSINDKLIVGNDKISLQQSMKIAHPTYKKGAQRRTAEDSMSYFQWAPTLQVNQCYSSWKYAPSKPWNGG